MPLWSSSSLFWKLGLLEGNWCLSRVFLSFCVRSASHWLSSYSLARSYEILLDRLSSAARISLSLWKLFSFSYSSFFRLSLMMLYRLTTDFSDSANLPSLSLSSLSCSARPSYWLFSCFISLCSTATFFPSASISHVPADALAFSCSLRSTSRSMPTTLCYRSKIYSCSSSLSLTKWSICSCKALTLLADSASTSLHLPHDYRSAGL